MLLAAVLFATGADSVAAQATGTTRDWFAFRDSLAAHTDVAALHRLQAQLPTPGAAASPDALIARGLIRLRVYEVTGESVDGELAKDVFERGVERFSRVAWMHYGLALAQQARARAGPGEGLTVGASLAEILGRDPRARARAAAQRALEIDPSWAPPAVLIAELAVEDGRDRSALEDAKLALAGVRAAGGETPQVARALADVQTALGEYAEAETSAAGTDAASSHARAVALLLQAGREGEGARTYFATVDVLDGITAERVYRDVETIVAPDEAADWRAADLAGRRLWFHRFWGRRAAGSAVTEADRLAEHYRRLALARREYLRNSRRGVDGAGVLLSESWSSGSPFDDRGIILLRRGVPQQIVETRLDGVLPNETWVYADLAGRGNVLFHFAALRGSRDYNLVSSLLEALEPKLDPVLDKVRFDRAVLTLLEDRAAFEPGYQAAAGRLRSLLLSLPAEEVRVRDATEIRNLVKRTVERVDADYRQEARVALAADVHAARFDRALAFHYDLVTFRAPFGRTDLTALFAVPAQDLGAQEAAATFVYPVNISVILMDTLTDAVIRRDTMQRVTTPAPLRAGEFLRLHVTLPVTPSEHTVYRVVAASPAIGSGSVETGARTLRDYSGLELQISDLVLATADSAGDWTRGDLRLALTLPRRFEPGRPFTLFYEIYNLDADSPYRTQIRVDPVDAGGAWNAVKRLFGSGSPRIDLRFDDIAAPADDGAIRQLRNLESELPPGRYRMRVTVTHAATGQRAENETTFEVIR